MEKQNKILINQFEDCDDGDNLKNQAGSTLNDKKQKMKLSNVMIYFDQALYETPPIIVQLE